MPGFDDLSAFAADRRESGLSSAVQMDSPQDALGQTVQVLNRPLKWGRPESMPPPAIPTPGAGDCVRD
jgi:hypothetical protein